MHLRTLWFVSVKIRGSKSTRALYSPEAWSVLAFPGSFYRQDGEKAAVILHKSSDFWCRGKMWEDVESRGDESGRVMVGHGARRGACETCQNTYWLMHSTRSWVKAALVSGDSASDEVRLAGECTSVDFATEQSSGRAEMIFFRRNSGGSIRSHGRCVACARRSPDLGGQVM